MVHQDLRSPLQLYIIFEWLLQADFAALLTTGLFLGFFKTLHVGMRNFYFV